MYLVHSWINNCVGARNQASFLVFLMTIVVDSLVIGGLAISSLLYRTQLPASVAPAANNGQTILITISSVLSVLCTCLAIASGTMVYYQSRNISRNLTTNEVFNADRYPYLKTPLNEFINPYDKGMYKNWKQVCCNTSSSQPDRVCIS